MGLINKNKEHETSGGQIFGILLIVAAVIFIVLFGIFYITNSGSAGDDFGKDTKIESENTEYEVNENI